MPVDVASAIPVKKPGQEPGSTVPVKVLGGCAVLLLATMLYNSIGGWHAQSHGQRSVQPAALPLQRRMRKSRFARLDDADSPSEVAVELQPQPEPEPQLQPDPARGPTLAPHPQHASSTACAHLTLPPQVMVEELVARDGKGMRKGRGGRGKGKGGGVLTCAPCRSRAVRSGCSWRPAVPRAPEAQGSLPRGCAPLYVRHTPASLGRAARTACRVCTAGGGLAAVFANQPASLRVQTPNGLVFAVPPPPPAPPPAPSASKPNATAAGESAVASAAAAQGQRRVDATPPNAGAPMNMTTT